MVVGSLASQGYKCHRWFVNGLSDMVERLGLGEWEEARRVLAGYFYTEQVSEKRAEEDLWNEVLLKASCELFFPSLLRSIGLSSVLTYLVDSYIVPRPTWV
jgi:hypothetical protein